MGKVYMYNGPVYEFNTLIASKWKGQTFATSEVKARSNLTYQFKNQTNRGASSNIRLTGKIIAV